jgi:hypothetical protein
LWLIYFLETAIFWLVSWLHWLDSTLLIRLDLFTVWLVLLRLFWLSFGRQILFWLWGIGNKEGWALIFLFLFTLIRLLLLWNYFLHLLRNDSLNLFWHNSLTFLLNDFFNLKFRLKNNFRL